MPKAASQDPVPEWHAAYLTEADVNLELVKQIAQALRARKRSKRATDWGDVGDMNELNLLLERAIAIAQPKS